MPPVIARLPFEPDTAIALATTSTEARELRRTPLVRELRSPHRFACTGA